MGDARACLRGPTLTGQGLLRHTFPPAAELDWYPVNRTQAMPGIRFRSFLIASGAAALLLAAPATMSRTYKWVDDEGITHYSQSRPTDRSAQEMTLRTAVGAESAGKCRDLTCRAARLESERRQRESAAQKKRDAAAKAAASYPVFPTPVKETDEEKIARLVAECKQKRGSRCDSDEEKRRMLLQNVDLTHAERRALRGFSPAVQRRFLLERIPKQYRNLD